MRQTICSCVDFIYTRPPPLLPLPELTRTTYCLLKFWGFANDIVSVSEAKRYYPLFGLGANVALIFSGQYVRCVTCRLVVCFRHATPHRTTPHHTAPHHTTPHRTTPHHTTPHHTTPHYTTPHHTTPHHTTLHHTTPHCTTQHHTTPHHTTQHHTIASF